MAIQVGCGSWSDAEYRGILYPPGLPANRRLSGYAYWFGHVEVNASFYIIPERKTLANWDEQTPPGFLFDFKLHRTLSGHGGGLPPGLRKKGPPRPWPDGGQLRETAAYTLEQLEPMMKAKKLGAFLLLLAPRFTPDRHRLEELDPLVEAIRPHSLAVELRQRAWVEGKTRASTLAYFRERGITWVAVDMPDSKEPNVMPAIDEVTQPKLAYLRLHGRNEQGYLHGKSAAERFHYDYSAAELKEIVARIKRLASQAEDVRVVASNHAEDFAPKAALALKRLLGQPLPPPATGQDELF
jgi:uncharacterized protein YecE (DUF72 family)